MWPVASSPPRSHPENPAAKVSFQPHGSLARGHKHRPVSPEADTHTELQAQRDTGARMYTHVDTDAPASTDTCAIIGKCLCAHTHTHTQMHNRHTCAQTPRKACMHTHTQMHRHTCILHFIFVDSLVIVAATICQRQ